MNLTVQDIYNLNEGLIVVNEKDLPIKVALKLQRNSLKVNEEYNVASGIRRKIIDKYKDKKLDNGNVKIKKDKIEVYNKEIKELMEQDVKIELEKINPSDLGETIKPRTLILIDKILKKASEDDSRDKK